MEDATQKIKQLREKYIQKARTYMENNGDPLAASIVHPDGIFQGLIVVDLIRHNYLIEQFNKGFYSQYLNGLNASPQMVAEQREKDFFSVDASCKEYKSAQQSRENFEQFLSKLAEMSSSKN